MNPFRAPERTLLLSATLAFALFLLFIGAKWVRYGSETAPVGFGCFSETACFSRENKGFLPAQALIYRSGGYDGQFFFYMGAALFGPGTATLDAPALRWSRVGYSLLTGWAALWSPLAQVRAMWLVPLFLHLAALLGLFNFYRRQGLSRLPESKIALWAFALNPFSLFSFSLSLADGPALSLMVLGLTFAYREPGAPAARIRRLLGAAFITLSLLSKETMLFLPAGFIAAALLLHLRKRSELISEIAFWISPVIFLLLWWLWIDFSPFFAADRGGPPFVGLFNYLANPDTLSSPRGLLLLFLAFFLALFGRLLFSGLKNNPNLTLKRDALALALGMFLILTLISFATASEYWMNFANISRMFTAGILIMSFAPLALGPGRFTRILAWTGLILCILLDLSLLERELTGKLLETFAASRG